MSKSEQERMESLGYTRATCRLCGQAWQVPEYVAKEISAERPYECPYCQKKLISKYDAMIYTS